jgi:PAS domain S-box-containing protein
MSFRLKTIIGVAVIEAVLLLLLIWTGISYLRTAEERELIKRASTTLTLLSRASRDAVLSTDIATLEDIVSEAVKTPGLDYVRILDGNDVTLASAHNSEHDEAAFRQDHTYEGVDDNVFDTAIDISESNSHYGRIEIGLSTEHIDSSIAKARQKASAIALLEMVLVALFSLALGTYLTRQLYGLMKASDKVAGGDYGYQLDIRGNDELAQTATAFNRMSTKLKLDREMQQAILRSALDCIITADETGCIIEFNKAAEQTFGYARQDVLGRPLNQLLLQAENGDTATRLPERLDTGIDPILDRHVQVLARRATGDDFPAELALTRVDINDNRLFIAYLRDITDRLQDEIELTQARDAAEAADKAKTRFVANMSHEIRTPLNSLLGFVNLPGEADNLTGEQRLWVRTAQQSGDSLLGLINDTLDFARIEAGKVVLERHNFDIRELVNGTVSTLSRRAIAKGLAFSATVAPEIPAQVREDSGRLRQILINLLGNAIKFTDKGSIRLALGQAERDDRPWLHLEIIDTGSGIPANQHDAIFSEFIQVVDPARQTDGTGLGLAITRRLVELMGGHIDFESREHQGTRFWFELPLTVVDKEEMHGEAASPRAPSIPAMQGRILLADDSPANQMVAMAMIRDSGCSVDTANNGLEAVEAVRTLPYDLVLMDISMPEMDGLAATMAIRSLPGDRGRLPIIAMTAHAIVGDREKFLQAGMSDYISKPITKNRLYEILNQWLPGEQITMHEDMQPTSTPAHTPVLDTGVFEQLARDTSPEIVPKMLAAFSQETAGRIDTLKQLADAGAASHEQLQREAHTLKSSAATFGATELHAIARDVEMACRAGEPDRARSMLAALIDSGERAISAVEAYLAGQAAAQTEAANP